MKTRHLIILAFLFALTIVRAEGGDLRSEDALDKNYWQSLSPESKIVFVTAYRHGQGPVEDQTAKPAFRVLTTDHFPTLIAKLDQFYKNPDNQHVFLSWAIRISFMEMSGKPQGDIDTVIKQARAIYLQL